MTVILGDCECECFVGVVILITQRLRGEEDGAYIVLERVEGEEEWLR